MRLSIDLLVDVLGCKAASFPSSYLGDPFKSKAAWDSMVERLEKLAGWKM